MKRFLVTGSGGFFTPLLAKLPFSEGFHDRGSGDVNLHSGNIWLRARSKSGSRASSICFSVPTLGDLGVFDA